MSSSTAHRLAALTRQDRRFDPLPEVDLLALIGADTTLRRVSGARGGEYAGPCPFCGGKDRFRVQPAHGRWWCRQCAGSDHWASAADYLIRRDHLTFPQAAAYLRAHYGDRPARPAGVAAPQARARGGGSGASAQSGGATQSDGSDGSDESAQSAQSGACTGSDQSAQSGGVVPCGQPGACTQSGRSGRSGRSGPSDPPADRLTYYLYHDEAGHALFRVRRLDLAGGGKRISQERPSPDGTGWLPGITGVRRVLYRLPELLAAPPQRLVFIVEGERCVEALREPGFVATCNPGGTGMGWRDDYGVALAGRVVIVLPDHDEPGYRHAARIAARLEGMVLSLRVLALPGLPPGGDVVDWFAAGGTPQDLLALVKAAPLAPPRAPAADGAPAGPTPALGGARPPASEEPWPAPIPLTEEAPLPPFPLAVFPDWLHQYVEGLAMETQTPPEMAALLALATLALCAGRRARITVGATWSEPLCLFVLVVARAGARKSGVYHHVTRPVRHYERAYNELHGPAMQHAASVRRILEQRLRRAESAAEKAADMAEGAARVRELAGELAAHSVPPPLSLVETDITPEALGVTLAEQGGSLAVMSPEGGTLATITGAQYGDRGTLNLDAVLNGHAGEDIKVRRVGRPPLYIADPALTLALTVQPMVLMGLAATPAYKGRGLLARFLYAVPADLLGARDVAPPAMPYAVRERYEQSIRALLDLRPATDAQGKPSRHELRLNADAHAALLEFMRWLEPQLVADGALGGDDAWGSKLAGAVARIAALLHLARYEPGHAIHLQVGAEVTHSAITLARDYLIPHARAALRAMGADPAREQARHILAWIERGRKTTFSRRDLYRDLRARFEQPGAADPALGLLCELGYLRPIDERPTGRGRKPGATYAVFPGLVAPPAHTPATRQCDVDGEVQP